MPQTASNLRELHALHQRAKALKDRLASAPKTLATRQAVLAKRQAELELAKQAVKDARARCKAKETLAGGMTAKTEDLRVKLNSVKKQVEYDAIRNQLAHDNLAIAKLEDEILGAMTKADDQALVVAAQEAEVLKLEGEVKALAADIAAKAEGQKAQLQELEVALVEAEAFIAEDQREQYRRNVKQRGADAMAPLEHNACTGCFVSVTTQMLNELINGGKIIFCKTCGRILYLEEDAIPSAHSTGR